MKFPLTLLFTTISIVLFAQKKEEFFDFQFKPTKTSARYYVTTESKDGRWYREAYYYPESSMAMKGWYKDEACKNPDEEITWYHQNRTLKSISRYSNGKLNGVQLSYHDNGMMQDSTFYENGHPKGVSLGWDNDGYQIDSSNFDGNGNGVFVHWYPNGPVSATGFFQNDTLKVKRWTYYHKNGKIMATREFTNGEASSCKCFNENGDALNLSTDECEGVEANFPGEEKAWQTWLAKTLNPNVPVKNKAPVGLYTVLVQFIVDTEGKVKDIKTLTNYGFGMEKEAIRVISKSPKWNPASQFGRKVNAYRRQPISFQITDAN